MYEVPSHRVQEVRVLVDYILIIEKELVWLQQLLLFYIQHVLLDVVSHYLVIFHIVVRDRLPAEHNQVVCVHHVQPNQPNSSIHYCVQHYPKVPLHI